VQALVAVLIRMCTWYVNFCAKQFALECEFQTQNMLCVFGTMDDDFSMQLNRTLD
jgi:hypothetical protein